VVEEESATCARLAWKKVGKEENFHNILKWKIKAEDAQSRFLSVVQERDNLKRSGPDIEERGW
jgi:hypothetical protein